MVLDASLLNTQHYKVQTKGKEKNPGKRVVLSLHLDVVTIRKGVFSSSSTTVGQQLWWMDRQI